jgi:hypothetical protein
MSVTNASHTCFRARHLPRMKNDTRLQEHERASTRARRASTSEKGRETLVDLACTWKGTQTASVRFVSRRASHMRVRTGSTHRYDLR